MSRLALLIGCSTYRDPKFKRLTKPNADVASLAGLLRDPRIGAFDDVQTSIDETFATVQVRVGRLFSNRTPDDLLFFFFAGHGVKDEGGQLYLALADTEAELLDATALSADFLVRQMDRSRSRKQLVILDCCFSGAFRGTRAGASVGTATTFGEGVGRVVLTATDSFQYAWENEEKLSPTNSVFTHFLVEGLATGRADTDRDGIITADNLYDYVYTHVRAATPNQTPHRSVHGGAGSLFVAHNPYTLLPLPPELANLLTHVLPGAREAAIDELTRLMSDPLDPLARSARDALEQLAKDRDARVRARARDALTVPGRPAADATPAKTTPSRPPSRAKVVERATPTPPRRATSVSRMIAIAVLAVLLLTAAITSLRLWILEPIFRKEKAIVLPSDPDTTNTLTRTTTTAVATTTTAADKFEGREAHVTDTGTAESRSAGTTASNDTGPPAPYAGPWYVTFATTPDQKRAEGLAVRLINDGFPSAYVERRQGSNGPLYRTRVKFQSNGEATAATEKLRTYVQEEITVSRN